MSSLRGRLLVVILEMTGDDGERLFVALARVAVAVADAVVVDEVGVELSLAEGDSDVGSTELCSLRLGVAVVG
jgi:hypothetical protein